MAETAMLDSLESKLGTLEERLHKLEEFAETENKFTANAVGVIEPSESVPSVELSILLAQKESLYVENLKLKRDIERLNYRVKHLVKALNAEESKSIQS